ncbi:MAG: tRNA (guanosine(46)-N7)-methyltransferase TrmB [Clostridia bacterium]|nr:tRNA (guanosine(46)-N7)-methyltransferase TrmB [Clostridia bacterium]MDD4386653.1 tRNA (guanosine(46)-N7)-methyltransferase TrmB [Clostridia bacterium]
MRTRYNKNADNDLNKYDKYINSKEQLQTILKEQQKVNIEIGMGKGEYISKMARTNPDTIYIGVEISKSVLALAAKKISRYEIQNDIKLNNLYIMALDAIKINEFFNHNQIDIIYLNFSDPWPKFKHEKRRLTNEMFLKEYIKVLKKDGHVRIKTDNLKLFQYTLVSMNNFGFKFEEIYLDLHKTNIDNVLTEYESKFCEKGPIYMLVSKFK